MADTAREPMRVLVACEFSGVVREAFNQRGHRATSAGIVPPARIYYPLTFPEIIIREMFLRSLIKGGIL